MHDAEGKNISRITIDNESPSEPGKDKNEKSMRVLCYKHKRVCNKHLSKNT
jgi:hypothetical protein